MFVRRELATRELIIFEKAGKDEGPKGLGKPRLKFTAVGDQLTAQRGQLLALT